MATIAKLNVLLNLDDSGFARSLETSRQKLDSWGSSLRSTGAKLTAGVTTPIVGASAAAIKWASDLEQTHGATEQLWGDNADAIFAWAKGADKSMGMTENSALQNANRFNAMFKQTDEGADSIKNMSMGFTQLSADMSAMWGGSPDEAADALTAALRGNYEGLDKYNINLTEAMVNTRAMEIAVADGRDEITEADKVMARHSLITEQSADAQGQFARETDTTAGKLAIATARAKNAATAFGKLLLPYVNKLLDGFSKMVTWIENLSDTQRKWVLGIAAVAAAMGPVLIIIGMILPGLGALLAVLGFLLSPIGLIVVAVGLLAYIFRDELLVAAKWLIDTFNDLKDAFNKFHDLGMNPVQSALIALAQVFPQLATVIAPLRGLVENLGDAFNALKEGNYSAMFSALWESLKSLGSTLKAAIGLIAPALGDLLLVLWAKGQELAQGLWDGAKNLWDTSVVPWFSGLSDSAYTWIGDTSATLMQKGTDIIQGFFTAVTTGWTTVSTWFTNMKNLAFMAVSDTLSTLKSRGTDILQGFWDGVTGKWSAVSLWFVNLPTMIFNAVSNTSSTLKSRGTDILQGFWQGVLDKWFAVSTWFSSLGSMILGAVGNLGSSLYNAGVSIMNGLWDGLKAGWGNVTGWLSGLNPADWKGPEARDKKMLYMPGIWIMQGLGRGLGEGWDDVTRQLSGYTPSISGGLNSAHAGVSGSTIVNHNYFVTPEALKEMIEGGKFAREFAGELGMMEGVA